MASKRVQTKDLADFDFGDTGPIDTGGGDPNPIPQTPPDFGDNGGGSIAPGDSAQGGGGIDPGSGTIPFDQAAFTRMLTQLGGGSAASGLTRFLQQLGLSNGDGSTNPLNWLSALAPLLGGLLSYHATGQARDQMNTAVNNANDYLKTTISGDKANFQPFMDAGKSSVTALQAPAPQLAGQFGALAPQFGALAGKFAPLGSGRGIVPGVMAPPQGGGMGTPATIKPLGAATLGQLMQRRG
jgi:hypothetical protein